MAKVQNGSQKNMNQIAPTLVDSVPAEEVPVTPEATPSPAPVESAPVEPAAPAVETKAAEAPAVQLYDLPDGRKVTGEEVAQEYKNLLSDYTRKSQKIVELEKPAQSKDDNIPAWQKPDYTPSSYAEIVEIAKQAALNEIQSRTAAEQAQVAQMTQQIDNTINELKKVDPTLDENSLFQHATKYGFRDLNVAYSNMKDMRAAIKDAQDTTVKNLKSRSTDPVSGGSAQSEAGVDRAAISNFRSAQEYLSHIKGS